jgi:hypothetical protein
MLYIGGSFNEINGQERLYLASYNLATNSLSTWDPALNDTVYDLFIENNRLYAGGAFTTVNTVNHNHIVAFELPNNTLLDWNPSVDMIITHLESKDNTLVATGFLNLNEQVIAKQVVLDTKNASVIKEEEIPIEKATSSIYVSVPEESTTSGLMVDSSALGFKIPSLGDILTFAIRGFFVVAGLAALFYMLLGAFAWVTSGGDSEAVSAAQGKIQAAVVGLLIMVAVLGLVWTLEQVVFNRRICLGLSCPVTIPALLKPSQ